MQGNECHRKMSASLVHIGNLCPYSPYWMSHWNSWDSANVCLINWRQLGTIYIKSHNPSFTLLDKKNVNCCVTVAVYFSNKGLSRVRSRAFVQASLFIQIYLECRKPWSNIKEYKQYIKQGKLLSVIHTVGRCNMNYVICSLTHN